MLPMTNARRGVPLLNSVLRVGDSPQKVLSQSPGEAGTPAGPRYGPNDP